MVSNQIDVLKNLELTKNAREKRKLSNMISLDLVENSEYYKLQVYSHFSSFLRKIDSLVGSFHEDLFILRIEIYTDLDYSEKMAIGLSFLPERRTFSEEDEDDILDSMEKELSIMNLDQVVNDISVNSKQRLLGGSENGE